MNLFFTSSLLLGVLLTFGHGYRESVFEKALVQGGDSEERMALWRRVFVTLLQLHLREFGDQLSSKERQLLLDEIKRLEKGAYVIIPVQDKTINKNNKKGGGGSSGGTVSTGHGEANLLSNLLDFKALEEARRDVIQERQQNVLSAIEKLME